MFSPSFIESVIDYTKNIYVSDFNQKKEECGSEEERENLKLEQVYDEWDRQLFEELDKFSENYNKVNQLLYHHLMSLYSQNEAAGEEDIYMQDLSHHSS